MAYYKLYHLIHRRTDWEKIMNTANPNAVKNAKMKNRSTLLKLLYMAKFIEEIIE